MNKFKMKLLRLKIIKFLTLVDHSGKIKNYIKYFIPAKPLKFAEKIESADSITLDWPVSLPKPFVGLVRGRIHRHAFWPNYERFLKNNDIPFEYNDVHRSDFMTQAKQ